VSDFKQTARSVTGSVSRAIDATTTKAELGVTVVHGLEVLQQLAILASSIPNALLEDMNQLSDFLQAEMRFQVFSALDAHIVAQLIAASPPTFSTGANDVEKLRYAVADMGRTWHVAERSRMFDGLRSVARPGDERNRHAVSVRTADARRREPALGTASRCDAGHDRP
jgi:hypothetical protein